MSKIWWLIGWLGRRFEIILGFLLIIIIAITSWVIALVATFLLTVLATNKGVVWYAKRKGIDLSRWSLRGVWLRFKHWRFGRRAYGMTKEMEEYDKLGYYMRKD